MQTIPVAVGAVTVPFNLAACGIGREQITLSSTQISDIFLGLTTTWNEPTLTATNANLAGCGLPITVVVRDAVSGDDAHLQGLGRATTSASRR